MTSESVGQRLPSLHVENRIGEIRFNDPATYNALSPAAFGRLREICSDIRRRANRDIGAVVLTGSGKAFCSGAELGSTFASHDASSGKSLGKHIAEWTAAEGTPAIMEWKALPLPKVVAVNGVVSGIGLSIALAGDIVVAARSATFSVPYMPVLGLVPDGGLTWLLPRLIGTARSMALTLLGERITAMQAESWGMIWRCVEDRDLRDVTHALATRLASLPDYATSAIRELFAMSWHNEFAAQYDGELKRNTELLDGEAFRQRLRAFLDNKTASSRG